MHNSTQLKEITASNNSKEEGCQTANSDIFKMHRDSGVFTSSTSKLFQTSWSVYKQLTSSLRLHSLKCMVTADEAISTRSLDVKAKLLEAQQLEMEIQQFIAKETFTERLKRAFEFDIYTGEPSPIQVRAKILFKTVCGAFFGFGFWKGYKEGKEDFMRVHKTTMFASKGAAEKTRYNHMVKHALRQGIGLTAKGGPFVLSIYAIYQCLEIYWNKSTPWSLAIATGTAGTLRAISLGPKGMFAGAVFGLVFGTIGGFTSLLALKMAHETQEELNYKSIKKHILGKRMKIRKDQVPIMDYHEDVDDLD